jgi:hypothetical protein
MSMRRLIGRLEEGKGKGSAATSLRDMADRFEKKVDYEEAHGGSGGADADTFDNWRETIDFLRELADIASRGGDVAAAFNAGKSVMSRKVIKNNRSVETGITDWKGFESTISDVRAIVGGK